jgi:hypothetical protein
MNVLPTTFTFFGCPVAFQVFDQLFENTNFHSVKTVIVTIVVLTNALFSFLMLLAGLNWNNFNKNTFSFLQIIRFVVVHRH